MSEIIYTEPVPEIPDVDPGPVIIDPDPEGASGDTAEIPEVTGDEAYEPTPEPATLAVLPSAEDMPDSYAFPSDEISQVQAGGESEEVVPDFVPGENKVKILKDGLLVNGTVPAKDTTISVPLYMFQMSSDEQVLAYGDVFFEPVS